MPILTKTEWEAVYAQLMLCTMQLGNTEQNIPILDKIDKYLKGFGSPEYPTEIKKPVKRALTVVE